MAQADDHEAERFFEQLGGGSENAGHQPHGSSASALRHALRAEGHTLKAARQARPEDLSAQERATLGALKQRLLADGVLGRPQSAHPAPREPHPAGFLHWVRKAVLGESAGWRPAGVAASVVLVGLLALQLGGPHPPEDEDQVRSGGSTELVIVDAAPGARAESLASTLRAAGASVVVVPINERETLVVVNIEDASRLQAVHAAVLDAGVRVEAQANYRLSVRVPK